jgi:3-hydroxybutyryl-CoA dehydratase
MMRVLNRYFDEIQVGDRYTSRGRTITEADIVNFSGITGDWYPLHTDIEYAKNTAFKQRIAHGMLILSIATGLVPLTPGFLVAFYGMEQVRFTNPTFIGDTIHVEDEVIEKTDKGDKGGVVSFRRVIKKHSGEIVVSLIAKALMSKNKAAQTIELG